SLTGTDQDKTPSQEGVDGEASMNQHSGGRLCCAVLRAGAATRPPAGAGGGQGKGTAPESIRKEPLASSARKPANTNQSTDAEALAPPRGGPVPPPGS